MADYNLLNSLLYNYLQTHSFTPIARHFAERVGLRVPPTASQLFELVKTHLFSLSLYDPFLAPGFGYAPPQQFGGIRPDFPGFGYAPPQQFGGIRPDFPGFGYGHNAAATYYHHGHPNQFAVPPQQFGGIRPDFPAPPHQQFGQPLPPHGGIRQFAVPPRHFAQRLNVPHNQQLRGIHPDFPVPPHQQQFGQPLGIRQGGIHQGGIHQYFAVPPLPNQFGQAPPYPVGPIHQFAVPPLPNQFGQAPPNPVGPINQFAGIDHDVADVNQNNVGGANGENMAEDSDSESDSDSDSEDSDSDSDSEDSDSDDSQILSD